MQSREQVMGNMLHHVLSRCRRCHRRRPCPEYAALEAEYDAFKRGEHDMNDEKEYQRAADPLCTCGDPASGHKNGHGSCSALKTPTQICSCVYFKYAGRTSQDEKSDASEYYQPEPEGDED